jgi:adenine nucleotide transporter 17
LIDLIHEHGLISLYDGITSSLLGAVVQNASFFSSCKFWKYALENLNINPIFESMLINWLSALNTVFITNPIWVLNTRMAKKSVEVYFIFIV